MGACEPHGRWLVAYGSLYAQRPHPLAGTAHASFELSLVWVDSAVQVSHVIWATLLFIQLRSTRADQRALSRWEQDTGPASGVNGGSWRSPDPALLFSRHGAQLLRTTAAFAIGLAAGVDAADVAARFGPNPHAARAQQGLSLGSAGKSSRLGVARRVPQADRLAAQAVADSFSVSCGRVRVRRRPPAGRQGPQRD